MILSRLNLKNFRNYSKSEFHFSDKTNLIVGSNAVGKTNILEAIYFLATGKSFRVKGVEREAIRYGEEIGRIQGWVVSCELGCGGEDGGKHLEIMLTTGEVGGEKVGKKKHLINGVAKRQFDFLGNLRAVYFGPEDLELITDSPGLRRRYLDSVLVQIDKEYARASLSYEKGLRQRNRILEEFRKRTVNGLGGTEGIDRRRFYFWDQLIIKNGNIITRKREEFIEFVNSKKQEGQGNFGIEYDRSTISPERLAIYINEELAAGVTLVGPHRDDFKFKVQKPALSLPKGSKFKVNEEERDLSIYGSRGEQRLAILWLKLQEMAYLKEKTNDLPVLLLDDIFSELDMEHRKLVFGLIAGHQTIITTADVGMVDKKWLRGVKIMELGAQTPS